MVGIGTARDSHEIAKQIVIIRLFALFLSGLVGVCLDVIQSDVRCIFDFLATALCQMTMVMND